MTGTGELFGATPAACPFIALELDRDRRSDKPDYRHRCYAEPTPQPRAIAHQEAYCLSANFPDCPIFQGWAMRAAARPVPAPLSPEDRGASSAGAEGPLRPPDQPPLPADVAPIVPAAGEPWPGEAFAPVEDEDAPQQMGAFDSAAEQPSDAGSLGATAGGASFIPPPVPASPTAWSPDASADEPDEAPVPGFLAGRSERESGRPRVTRPEVQLREKIKREDLIPSWDLTDRYGASVKEERVAGGGGGGGDRFGGLVTAIAVIAILALGVAGVIFLPGLLSGRHDATPTPSTLASPTLPPLNSGSPFNSATPAVTVAPSGVPTVAPQPTPTPRLYRIKPGDQLAKIAKRFHVSVADILAANPQITDPDHIVVGQLIVIPQPPATQAPSASP